MFLEHVEKFAASAANIEHVRRAREIRYVFADAGSNFLLIPPEQILESHVGRSLGRRIQPVGGRGRCHRLLGLGLGGV